MELERRTTPFGQHVSFIQAYIKEMQQPGIKKKDNERNL